MKRLSLLLLTLFSVLTAFSQAFESHRASSLFVLPQTDSDIVFIGNSITNLHNWNEAFGGARILNRGISGETTAGLETRLPAYIDGQPKKIFLMLGTNDFEPSVNKTPAQVARTMRAVIRRIVETCPATELYVQSILTSTYKTRTLAGIEATNTLLKNFIDSLADSRVTYLDIHSLLSGIAGPADRSLSYDGLHLTAKAYSIWCHALEPYIGLKTVYPNPATMTLRDGGLSSTPGMRATMCAALPVNPDDVLVIGGEMLAGGEWWELLGDSRVKNRACGWWQANVSLDEVNAMLTPIFHDGATPAKVFLYVGANEMNGNTTVDVAMTKYRNIVGRIRALSPTTDIYLLSLVPTADASRNTNKYVPFNSRLQAYAEATDGITFIDIYTPLVKNGVANPDYIADNYLQGRGYAVVAGRMGACLPGCQPVTEEEACERESARRAAIENILPAPSTPCKDTRCGVAPLPQSQLSSPLVSTSVTAKK